MNTLGKYEDELTGMDPKNSYVFHHKEDIQKKLVLVKHYLLNGDLPEDYKD